MLPQLLLNSLVSGSIYALIAVGLGAIYRVGGFIDFAQGAFFAVGAYCALVCATSLHIPLVVAMFLGAIAIAMLSAGYHACILTPLRRRHASKSVFLLASVGVFVAVEGILLLKFGAEARAFPSASVQEGLPLFGGRLTITQIVTISLAFFTICAWCLTISFTRLGLMGRAVASDRELAGLYGVRAKRLFRIAFVAASLTTGLAGMLQAWDTGLAPAMGSSVMLFALVAVMLSGKSALRNAIAALLLSVLQQIAVLIIPTYWQDAVVFLVLVVFMGFSPIVQQLWGIRRAGV